MEQKTQEIIKIENEMMNTLAMIGDRTDAVHQINAEIQGLLSKMGFLRGELRNEQMKAEKKAQTKPAENA